MFAPSLNLYLVVSAILFSIGTIGVLTRKNAIILFMCIEMMLNAVNLTLVAFSSYLGRSEGQMMVFFVMCVAAAEAVVGLAMLIAIFRNHQSVDLSRINIFKW
ncbi:MAG: NADH-quinone oxidoreductase subunit NuoK [Bacteroidia bacterium]|nr:NADH-quinone oxidoreductase subunit NuoK [Bacteroidia bacterium]MDW8301513.1 NADH-quinone oxidoreductase subunit NuoK [Bacteroidia bacterium]